MSISYYYNIYGLIVKSNIKMPLLDMTFGVYKFDLELNVEYFDIENENIVIKDQDDFFYVGLGGYADYSIYVRENKIICKAKDFESFFSTVFNIPFSVYMVLRQEILFHACSILNNNTLFCLSGTKGVGKSTLTHLLNDTSDFKIFGDDTIRIAGNRMGYIPHNLIKFTEETLNKLNVENTCNAKNAAGKIYSKFENDQLSAKIGSIICLNRSNDSIPKIKKIINPIIKRNMFISNIVGVSYFPQILLKNILNTKLYENINFYFLYTPNNIDRLIGLKDHVKELLLSERDAQ